MRCRATKTPIKKHPLKFFHCHREELLTVELNITQVELNVTQQVSLNAYI